MKKQPERVAEERTVGEECGALLLGILTCGVSLFWTEDGDLEPKKGRDGK